MEYIILVVCFLLLVSLSIYLIFKQKKKSKTTPESNNSLSINQNHNLAVKFEELSSADIEDSQLVEIKDQKLIQRFIDTIPNTSLAIKNTSQAQNLKSISEQLYYVRLPAGETLVDSKVKGAYRAFSRGDKGRIKHNANLIKADGTIDKIATTNLINAGYSLASAVVGQHYMAEIDSKLEKINSNLSKISAFQENEYRSRVCALIAEIQELTEFQLEIISNQENRNTRLSQLQDLNHECTVLLGQATTSINDIIKDESSDYKDYEDKISQANSWYQYQNTLLEILFHISELKYALHLGTVSKPQCFKTFSMYCKQVKDCQSKLQLWHQTNEDRFIIDTESAKRKRTGLEGFIFKIPAYIINEDLNYKAIPEKTARMIKTQKSENVYGQQDGVDLFKKDVDVIVKGGKLYYLPPTQTT